VGNVGRAVEDTVDAVTDIRPNDTAALGLGVRLDRISKIAEQRPGLDQLDSLFQGLASGLDDADGVGVSLGLVANVICFVEIAVKALMVQRNIEVDDITIKENSVVGDTVADHLVY